MPAPIPFDAPVTTATFPFSFPSFIVCPSFFGFWKFITSTCAHSRGLMRRPSIGHRTDLFPLPQNEQRLILSNELSRATWSIVLRGGEKDLCLAALKTRLSS